MKNKKTKKRRITLGEIWHYSSNMKKNILIADIVLVFLLLGIIVWFTLSKDKNVKKIIIPEEIIVENDNFIYNNGVLSFLDENGETKGTYNCVNQDPNLCYVANELNEDTFDEIKKYNVDGTIMPVRSNLYINQYAFIYDNATKEDRKVLLYNFKDNKVVGEYLGLKSIRSDLNIIENNYVILINNESKYGVLNLAGDLEKPIVPFTYDYLGIANDTIAETNNKMVYRLEDKFGLVDFKNVKIANTFTEIKDYSDIYVKTMVNGKYNLLNYDNEMIFTSYAYIDILKDYIVTIADNKFLTVYDKDLNKLINDDIVVKNEYYIPQKIYENKTLKEEKKAFELSNIGDILYINIFDEENVYENTFSLLESMISSKSDYFSYENNFIYVYSDLSKLSKIGKYKCSNKNVLSDSSESFNNCYIARDSIDPDKHSTPIYHSRFVFIYDAPTLVSDNTLKVTLYDLALNKILGQYKNILTYSTDSETKGNVYHVNEDDFYVTAINRNNKYGILKIEPNGVSKSIDFIYDDIKLQGKYLIGKTGDEWTLIDFDGSVIVEGKYILFELYNDMITTIDKDNNLRVHNYENKLYTNTPIKLTNTTSEISLALATEELLITVEGNTYRYNTTTGDKIEDGE